jgi:UDP-sulfoquinovose synthase
MKIIVLGGDGFCGWASSLRLSKKGHEVFIFDNLSRRSIDISLKVKSLTPISSIYERVKTWNKLNKKKIKFYKVDVAKDTEKLEALIKKIKPDTIVHFAEQRSAPYSMIDLKTRNYTISNNLISNNNILYLIAKLNPKIHLIHLGTMGVYGYDFSKYLVPEGYYKAKLFIKKNVINTKILHPASPGSIYHLTKAQDELLFQFYQRMHGLKITDLHQGVVWGTNTNETKMHKKLFNRYDYDGDYGTVLNRFIMQAALNYPLTVHGTGNQVRPFININNTADCILLAAQNRKKFDEVKIFNQLTETHSLINLANKIKKITGCKINHQKNPRIESEDNTLIAKPMGLIELGLKPIYLSDKLIKTEIEIAKMFEKRVDKRKIVAKSQWKI